MYGLKKCEKSMLHFIFIIPPEDFADICLHNIEDTLTDQPLTKFDEILSSSSEIMNNFVSDKKCHNGTEM